MKRALVLAIAMTFGAGAAEAARHPRACSLARLAGPLATVAALSAAPGTISFQATNPALGLVPGSSAATVTWTVQSGSQLQNWTINAQAGASAFAGCSTIPVSAVRATCGSASVSGGGGTGSCSGSFQLSTLAQQVAGGVQGDGTNSYSVSIGYTLDESWRYLASSSACTLTLIYTVNAP